MAQLTNLSGKVIDDQGPLPGVSVSLIGDRRIAISTDINGEFRYTNIKPGKYSLQLNFIGYNTEVRDIIVTGAAQNLESIQLRSNNKTLDMVEVTVENSRRATEARALSMQKVSNRIINVITSDGNPNLVPIKSYNFDLMAEPFLCNVGMITFCRYCIFVMRYNLAQKVYYIKLII